jgi:hypothetical protein
MARFYVVRYEAAERESTLGIMKNNSLLMLRELQRGMLAKGQYPLCGMRFAALCAGPFVNQAIEGLLGAEDVGKKLRFLAVRDDGRILDVQFVATVQPANLAVDLV